IAVGVAEIAGSRHFGLDRRPGKGRAFGPGRLLADGVLGVEAAAIHDFYSIFSEVGDKGSVAVLRDIRNEFGFKLDEEFGTCGGFLFRGKRNGSEEKQKCYGDFVHQMFSGRSGGGFLRYVRRQSYHAQSSGQRDAGRNRRSCSS